MDPRVHVFGIRHHGPGSAASLVAALEALAPAVVLIELPADVEDALGHAAAPGMTPPLALLGYDPKEPARATFLPFAEYSPEWQALQFATRRGVPARAIDVPLGVTLRPNDEDGEEDGKMEADVAAAPSDTTRDDAVDLGRDPLDALARVAGHSDGESWWDAVVERAPGGAGVFEAIAAVMSATREAQELVLDSADNPRHPAHARRASNELREAHMRLAIREALREFAGPLAVVVGAWHVPALARATTAKEDKARLQGVRPLKITATWVPWTEPRLASGAGYGAGVTSPGWYAHLWSWAASGPTRATAAWMARVARLLRDEGLGAATASAIDATRLALALASVRGFARPGLDEVQDAALAALCHGEPAALQVIARRLVVGERVGVVADGVPRMPLAEDLAREQRRLRLPPEATPRELALDLRTDGGLARSTLLHRLTLLGVDWGRLVAARAGRGTFREVWQLEWTPELAVRLAEAVQYGTTIVSAADAAARAKAATAHGPGAVAALAALVERALCAELEDAAELVLARLQAATVHADLDATLAAIPPLADVLRYGTARELPEEALRRLVSTLAAQALAGLGPASRGLDGEAAEALAGRVAGVDRALDVLDDSHLVARWLDALDAVARDEAAAPFIAGAATRRLSRDRWPAEDVAGALSRALSAPELAHAGAWLEGFLGAEAEVLLHDEALLGIVDAWLAAAEPEAFEASLPMLRRSFAPFDAMQRRRLLDAVSRVGQLNPATPHAPRDLPRALPRALPLLAAILGLESQGLDAEVAP